jgi:ElaB/YqjD/DUF883 family membrane-anchored ribosome-binding protein
MLGSNQKIDDAARTAIGIVDKCSDQAQTALHAAGNRVKEATSDMIETVNDTVHNVAASTTELVGKGADKAQEWASSVGDAAVYAKDQAQHATSATVKKIGDLEENVTAFIRRNPLPSLLVGVGVGFLLGQVLHHSSRKA